ncbi:hypothetical protein [Methanoculleus sp.]|uniref:hypothetical protein n=1 Tax=Methanoculleus sp. TaxID=90427 RepID=UPI0025DC204A|nr:hypothetical protein [Methanoculleus sp.]MCK9320116.1 hypothetical protein [Methanoculleus sp.]
MFENIETEVVWLGDFEDLDEFLINHRLSEEYNKIYEESDDDEHWSMQQLFKNHFDNDIRRFFYIYEKDSNAIQVYYVLLKEKIKEVEE